MSLRPLPRVVTLMLVVAMGMFGAAGFVGIRRNMTDFEVMSSENVLWSASQIEFELLRFQGSVAALRTAGTPEALAEVRRRFDILWSRAFMLDRGRVGGLLRSHDRQLGAVAELGAYLAAFDPVLVTLRPDDTAALDAILRDLAEQQRGLRLFTLRVVRGGIEGMSQLRAGLRRSSQVTALVTIASVLVGLLALLLILRETARQKQLAEMNRGIADAAEESSRAKSRFLSMVSHELRNPLNGVMGPLALLGQSGLAPAQQRLVQQAQTSGNAIVRMLSSLLDYAEMEDGRIRLHAEPLSPAALAEAVAASLAEGGHPGLRVDLRPGMPERIRGDFDRLRQIFVNLAEVVAERPDATLLALEFGHDGSHLMGDLIFEAAGPDIDRRLELLAAARGTAEGQVAREAIQPLIAHGLIAAAGGTVSLASISGGRRVVRVAVPAVPVAGERLRVHLETRSEALLALCRSALGSERVVISTCGSGPVDVVLVDAASVSDPPLTAELRVRFPRALFVSLGVTRTPQIFDEVIEAPADIPRLRSRILGRRAS